ncbi:MAG: hypothetical protein NVSMB52_00540 [Chloroflexota bacterium]
MKHLARYFPRAIVVVGAIAWGLTPQPNQAGVHAQGACVSVAAPANGNTPPNGTFDTAANIILTFDHARSLEHCSAPLSIDPAAYDAASPQQQVFMPFNAERRDRVLPELNLDTTLLSQVDANHSREMAQYGYQQHISPINHPGWNHIFDRIEQNPAIGGNHYVGENIAWNMNPAQSVYFYMYTDALSSWGHRESILGYEYGSNTPGGYNWVGIGVATGGPENIYYTSDFLQYTAYSPPASADTQAPTLDPPTASGSSGTVKVQANNVADAGAPAGVLGLTTVMFYAGPLTLDVSAGSSNAIAGSQSGSTWTATLQNVKPGDTIHAVALDGSGNYTDCVVGAASCGNGPPPPPAPTIKLIPPTGISGSHPTVSGGNFSPNEIIDFYWDTRNSTPVASTPADINGNYSLTLPIPDSTTFGSHGVIAVGETSNSSASTIFKIKAAISVLAGSGIVGSKQMFTGSGFGKAETVTVRWGSSGGPSAGSGPTNNTGSVSFPLTVPSKHGGAYTLFAAGSKSHTTATTVFTITPSLTIVPIRGLHGSSPRISGAGFHASKPVTIRWDCATNACKTLVLASPQASINGSFPPTLIHTPKSATPGTYSIAGTTTPGDFALTSYQITG